MASCSKEETKVVEEPEPENLPPVITNITSNQNIVKSGEQVILKCYANDPEGDPISYHWECTSGTFLTSVYDSEVVWEAGIVSTNMVVDLVCSIQSQGNGVVSDIEKITVMPADPEEHSLYIFTCNDTYLSSEYPDEIFGSLEYIYTSGSNSAYFQFNLDEIPNYATITSAHIYVIAGYNNTTVKPVGDMYIHSTLYYPWYEGSMTYNNSYTTPSDYPIAYETGVQFDMGNVYNFDITSNLLEFSEGIYSLYTLMVHTENLSVPSGAYLYSKEVGENYSARLYIKYILR